MAGLALEAAEADGTPLADPISSLIRARRFSTDRVPATVAEVGTTADGPAAELEPGTEVVRTPVEDELDAVDMMAQEQKQREIQLQQATPN